MPQSLPRPGPAHTYAPVPVHSPPPSPHTYIAHDHVLHTLLVHAQAHSLQDGRAAQIGGEDDDGVLEAARGRQMWGYLKVVGLSACPHIPPPHTHTPSPDGAALGVSNTTVIQDLCANIGGSVDECGHGGNACSRPPGGRSGTRLGNACDEVGLCTSCFAPSHSPLIQL